MFRFAKSQVEIGKTRQQQPHKKGIELSDLRQAFFIGQQTLIAITWIFLPALSLKYIRLLIVESVSEKSRLVLE